METEKGITPRTAALVAWSRTRRGKRVARFALAAVIGFSFGLLCSRLPVEYQAGCRFLAKITSLALGGG